jgi:hypothetical protein
VRPTRNQILGLIVLGLLALVYLLLRYEGKL